MRISAYFLFHFAIYFIFRLEFLIWNWPGLKILSFAQILQAFIYGVRFDLAALAATWGLFFLGVIWLSRIRIVKAIWFFLFAALEIFLILVNSVDTELVNFTGRRFSKSSFFLLNEGHAKNLMMGYLPLAVLTFLLIFIFLGAHIIFYKRPISRTNFGKKCLLTVATLMTSVVCFRGGLQHKPMTSVESRIFPDTMANHMILNSTFTLLKSLDKASLERLHFFDEKQMLSLLNGPSDHVSAHPQFKNANVVVLILESFSKEYTQLKNPEFTPYLNELSRKGIFFANGFANSRRSIEGIGAVLAGIPALMEEPFINSEFSSNEFIGLGHLLSRKGYHTSFFHGAKNGSMHFDAFSKSVGLQNYFGENEYPTQKDNDGTWGIFDGPFLNWTCEKMNGFTQPFMSAVFTLSSHQPYTLPPDEVHPEGSLPILKTIHYTDSALKKFMECASTKPWFNNTLFIITADHTGPSLNPDANFKSKFEIPILLYTSDPTKLAGMDQQQPAQQIDLLPTLLETLGIDQKSVSYLSRSLWQSGPKVIPLYADGVYELAGDVKDQDQQLKAIRQYFSEGLFDNRLYYPVGSSTK